MADAILVRRSVVKGELTLLEDIIVSGSAVTQIDITGLNLVKGEEYELVVTINGNNASGNILLMMFNGNYTEANYYTQWLTANGSTAPSGARFNNPYIAIANNRNTTLAKMKIKVTNNGYVVVQASNETSIVGSGITLNEHFMTTTFTVTNITSIRLIGSLASMIGIGSRFILYKTGGV